MVNVSKASGKTGSVGHWHQLIGLWELYLQAAGTPATTIGLRLYHVRRLAEAFPRGPSTVRFEPLVEWLAGQDWKPNTRRSYRSSLRSFWSWMLATGRTSESPAHLLPPVPIPRSKPRPTPDTVFRAALGIADERVRLAIYLGGTCGLRRSEIAGTKREDVEADLTGHSLRVVGKGGHVRLVPLPDEVARMILRMEPGWLFPSSHGGHLTPAHLGKLVTKALDGGGGTGHTTHTLRHRTGTKAYQHSKDIRAVQELLGHAKLDTTMIYTQVESSAVREAMLGAL